MSTPPRAASAGRPKALLVAVVIGAGLGSPIIILRSQHLPSTTIDLNVRATSVRFSLATGATLPALAQIAWIRIIGLESFELPATCPGGPARITRRTLEVRAPSGSIQFVVRDLLPQSVVAITHASARHLAVQFDAPPEGTLPDVEILTDGSFAMETTSSPCVSSGPQLIYLHPTRTMSFDAERAAGGSLVAAVAVPVSGLSFDRPADDHGAAFSTLQDGFINDLALPGWERTLRSHDRLRVQVQDGAIHAIRIEESNLAITFRGRVTGILRGPDDAASNLMPTRLEAFSTWIRGDAR